MIIIIIYGVLKIKRLKEENEQWKCLLDVANSTIQQLHKRILKKGLTLNKLNNAVDEMLSEPSPPNGVAVNCAKFPIIRLFVCGRCGNIYQKAFAETLYPKDEQLLKIIMGEEYIIPSDPNTVCMLICKECLDSIKKEKV